MFLFPLGAFAENAKVFFIGGFRASAKQMRCWESGARKNSPGGYDFEGVPYPNGAGSGYETAVAAASGQIKRIVAEINAHPEKHYVIAGHSSGAAISNTIAKRAKNPSRIKQVILDGFTSPRIPGATCWGSKGRNGKPSRNFSAMNSCGAGKRIYQDDHCSSASQWCLHFVIVDKSTPAKLTDFYNHGYDGCDTNLEWLK